MAPRITPSPLTLAGMAADLHGRADDRPPLVLLPGLTFDRRIWRPVLEALATRDPGRRVLALDLPGHGDSPAQPPHTFDRVVRLIHDAVSGAGLEAPVVVGHSMSGGFASLYAAEHATRGVVNLDGSPDLGAFTRLIQPMAPRLRDGGFDDVWAMIVAGFGIDRLPPKGQELVAATSRPEPDLVRGYWGELLARRPDDLDAMVRSAVRAVAATGVPYVFVGGAPLTPAAEAMIRDDMPAAQIEVWADGGHFPHLAYPDRFADLLLGTRAWSASPVRAT